MAELGEIAGAADAGAAQAAPVATVADAPAPIVEAAPAPVAAEAAPAAAEGPAPAEALAEPAAPAPEAAAPEQPAADEAKAAEPEAEAAAEPAAPTYEPWKLPDGLALAEAQSSALGNIFGKYGLTQEAGQELVDFAGTILADRQQQMLQDQHDTFLETRRKWANQTERELGNRYNTVTADARAAMELAVPAKEREAFTHMLRITGAGDHPLFIKAWGALGKKLREARAPGPLTPTPPQERREDRRYRSRAPN